MKCPRTHSLTCLMCALAADMCEIESDITPHRSHVARVLQQTMGVYPDTVNLETRYLVSAVHGTNAVLAVHGTSATQEAGRLR
jgi:hypothetical protein